MEIYHSKEVHDFDWEKGLISCGPLLFDPRDDLTGGLWSTHAKDINFPQRCHLWMRIFNRGSAPRTSMPFLLTTISQWQTLYKRRWVWIFVVSLIFLEKKSWYDFLILGSWGAAMVVVQRDIQGNISKLKKIQRGSSMKVLKHLIEEESRGEFSNGVEALLWLNRYQKFLKT